LEYLGQIAMGILRLGQTVGISRGWRDSAKFP
jgi:hypothetical protein